MNLYSPRILARAHLHLLPALRILLKERSVSRAARLLNLSQPATSHVLRQLRLLFDDPLLTKVGRQMKLTPRAMSLIPKLEQFWRDAETLLLEPSFDPRTQAQRFVVASPDYMALLLGAELVAHLSEAPNVEFRFVDAKLDYPQLLRDGKIDLAIVAFNEDRVRGLARSKGYPDRMVGVVHRKHPLARKKSIAGERRTFPELRVSVGEGESGLVRTPVPLNFGGNTRIVAEQFMVLPLLAAKSECVAVVPGALAHYMAQFVPLAILDLRGNRTRFDACAVWNPSRDADPAHAWLRNLIDDAMSRRLVPAGPPRAAGPRRKRNTESVNPG